MGAPAMAAAELALHTPMAMFSRSSGTAARRRARVLGTSRAPKAPWAPRSTMAPVIDPARPTPTDVRAKPTTPARKTRRRP